MSRFSEKSFLFHSLSTKESDEIIVREGVKKKKGLHIHLARSYIIYFVCVYTCAVQVLY